MTRPERCLYCKGTGEGPGAPCGFCHGGVPLDTQEDWNATWGALNCDLELLIEELERQSPGTRQRIEEIREQLEYAREGKCIACREHPTLAIETDHSCGDCEDIYDWYCWRCSPNGIDKEQE